MKLLYRKSSIKPPSPGAYLFQAHLRGSLIETGGIFKREGLFNLEKTTVSVLHKELEYKVEKLKYKKVGDAAEDHWESNPTFQVVNKPSRISPREPILMTNSLLAY